MFAAAFGLQEPSKQQMHMERRWEAALEELAERSGAYDLSRRAPQLPAQAGLHHHETEATKKFQDLKIFVGGIPRTMDQDTLTAIFCRFGARVQSANMPAPRSTGRYHRGFAFVEFADLASFELIMGGTESRYLDLGAGLRVEVKRALKTEEQNDQAATGAAAIPQPPLANNTFACLAAPWPGHGTEPGLHGQPGTAPCQAAPAQARRLQGVFGQPGAAPAQAEPEARMQREPQFLHLDLRPTFNGQPWPARAHPAAWPTRAGMMHNLPSAAVAAQGMEGLQAQAENLVMRDTRAQWPFPPPGLIARGATTAPDSLVDEHFPGGSRHSSRQAPAHFEDEPEVFLMSLSL